MTLYQSGAADLKLYTFEANTARPIQQYDSLNAQITHLVQTESQSSIVCIRIAAHGILGRHRAVQNQLFLVVDGSGEVSGDNDIFFEIETGQAAFWREGEFHTTRTKTGLTAVVVEGSDVLPSAGMKALVNEE